MAKRLLLAAATIAMLAINIPALARQVGGTSESTTTDGGGTAESEVARYERELASRLVEVTKAEEAEAAQRLIFEQLKASVGQARTEAPEAELQKAEQE